MVDDLTRVAGVATGITGMTIEETVGTSDPSAALVWSGYVISWYFVAGTFVFGLLAFRYRAESSRLGSRGTQPHHMSGA